MERDFLNASNYPRGENRFIKSKLFIISSTSMASYVHPVDGGAQKEHTHAGDVDIMLCYGGKNIQREWNGNITERINK